MEGQQQKNSYVQILGNVLTLISLKQAYKIHDKKRNRGTQQHYGANSHEEYLQSSGTIKITTKG